MATKFKIFANFFVPFLFVNDAFEKFVHNCHKSGIADLSRYLELTSPNHWLDYAFFYGHTPEGFQFWSDLSDEWALFLTVFNTSDL